MKPAMTTAPLEAPDPREGRLTELSAEATIRLELARIGSWLVEQGLDPRDDRAHADAGSRDRLYWRFGYFTGLQRALAVLTAGDATRH